LDEVIFPNKSFSTVLLLNKSLIIMSRIHLTIGIIAILIVAIVGVIMKLVTFGEGVIIALLMLISSPLLFNLLQKTPKHDD